MDGLLASVVGRSAAAVDDGAAGARSRVASARRPQIDLHESPIGLPEQPRRLRQVGLLLARCALELRLGTNAGLRSWSTACVKQDFQNEASSATPKNLI